CQCTDVYNFRSVGSSGVKPWPAYLLCDCTDEFILPYVGLTDDSKMPQFFSLGPKSFPRRGGPSGLATPLFSLSSLEPKSLRIVILTITLVQVLCCLYQSPKHYIEIWHERPFSLQVVILLYSKSVCLISLAKIVED